MLLIWNTFNSAIFLWQHLFKFSIFVWLYCSSFASVSNFQYIIIKREGSNSTVFELKANERTSSGSVSFIWISFVRIFRLELAGGILCHQFCHKNYIFEVARIRVDKVVLFLCPVIHSPHYILLERCNKQTGQYSRVHVVEDKANDQSYQ